MIQFSAQNMMSYVGTFICKQCKNFNKINVKQGWIINKSSRNFRIYCQIHVSGKLCLAALTSDRGYLFINTGTCRYCKKCFQDIFYQINRWEASQRFKISVFKNWQKLQWRWHTLRYPVHVLNTQCKRLSNVTRLDCIINVSFY